MACWCFFFFFFLTGFHVLNRYELKSPYGGQSLSYKPPPPPPPPPASRPALSVDPLGLERGVEPMTFGEYKQRTSLDLQARAQDQTQVGFGVTCNPDDPVQKAVIANMQVHQHF